MHYETLSPSTGQGGFDQAGPSQLGQTQVLTTLVDRSGGPHEALFVLLVSFTSMPMSRHMIIACSIQTPLYELCTWDFIWTGHCFLCKSLQISHTLGNSLRYLTSFSIMFYLLGCTTSSSLREHLSLTLDRSQLQRLRLSICFAIPLSMPTSWDGSQWFGFTTIQFHTMGRDSPASEQTDH